MQSGPEWPRGGLSGFPCENFHGMPMPTTKHDYHSTTMVSSTTTIFKGLGIGNGKFSLGLECSSSAEVELIFLNLKELVDLRARKALII